MSQKKEKTVKALPRVQRKEKTQAAKRPRRLGPEVQTEPQEEAPLPGTSTAAVRSRRQEHGVGEKVGPALRMRETPQISTESATSEQEGTSSSESDEEEGQLEPEELQQQPRKMHALSFKGKSPEYAALLTILNEVKADIKDVKEVIKDMRGLKLKVNKIENEVKKIQNDMEITEERVEGVENTVTVLEMENKQLQQKVDILENFSRRNNIKIVGLKEEEEGQDMTVFMKAWIPKVLGADNFDHEIEIERAHRALRAKPSRDQNPRSILVKFLRYRDRERVLQLVMDQARARGGPLMFRGARILFYPDISADLMKRRKEFNPAKKILWEKGYRFVLRHPATLKIFLSDQQNKFFTSFALAEEFVKELPQVLTDR